MVTESTCKPNKSWVDQGFIKVDHGLIELWVDGLIKEIMGW